MEGKGFYGVCLTRRQGSDYVTLNDRLESTASCEEGDYGYHVSDHEGQAGVHGEAWRRQNAAVYEVGESGTSSVTSSAVLGSDTVGQD